MKNSKGVSLIALIITIIVIIILAAIVMNASTSTVGNAQYARFAQEFGEYSDQVALDAANIKSQTGIKGQIINNAQMYFMVANGITTVTTSGEGVSGLTMPVGYVLTNNGNKTADGTHQWVLQSILGIGDASGDGKTCTARATDGQTPKVPSEASEVCYIIRDSAITNYTDGKPDGSNSDGSATHEFYGDSNGA
jgi:type II secretory pathway pseudopilin PulG